MHFAHALALALAAALLDVTLGYPLALYRAIGHPVLWMRAWGEALAAATGGRLGLATLALYLAPIAIVPIALAPFSANPAGFLIEAILASTLLSQQALDRRVRAIAAALERGDLDAARGGVAGLAGADTGRDEGALARAALEGLARHFARGVVAPLFWIAVGGLAGGAIYKGVEVAGAGPAARLLALLATPGDTLGTLLFLAASRFTTSGAATGAQQSPRLASRLADWPPKALTNALGVEPASSPAGDLRRGLALYRRAAAIEIVALAAGALTAALW